MRRAAVLALVAGCAAAHADPKPAASPIPASAKQLVTGVIADWDATAVTLRLWKRDGDHWVASGKPWPAVIGNGAAWGSGLHGAGAPAGRAGPGKREGDGKSPAGAFALRGAYGYAADPPRGTSLPYHRVDASWECVDDDASKHYTEVLDRRTAEVDWHSSELMRRKDALYTWVVDIAHNPDRKAGGGSCIFFHQWRREGARTVGCTAMAEGTLAALVAGLDPSAVYVLLPRAEYDALARPWNLPAN